MSFHPNRLSLERFFVQDLEEPAHAQVQAHVEVCASCQEDIASMLAEREQTLSLLGPDEFVARVKRRKRSASRLAGAAGAATVLVAAACVALVVFALPRPHPVEELRLKGAGAAIYRKRQEHVELLSSEDRIRAEDALRIAVTVPRAGRYWIGFVDADGRVDRLVQEDSVSLEVGTAVLPGSAVVDAPCRDLWLLLVDSAREPAPEQRLQGFRPSPGATWPIAAAMTVRLRCE